MTDQPGKFDHLPETRRRGLEKMEQVYGFEMSDGEGDFFRYTADHLFGEVWNRPGLSDRDRRLLLIGLLAGKGYADVLGIQVPAQLSVVGIDGHDLAPMFGLTTLAQHPKSQGMMAVRLLLDELTDFTEPLDRPASNWNTFPVSLEVRQSTTAPPLP